MTAKIIIHVEVVGRYETINCSAVVPESLNKVFTPIDICTNADIAALVNGVTQEQFDIHMERRNDAAKYISAAITNTLVHIMKSNDTKNGYKNDTTNS